MSKIFAAVFGLLFLVCAGLQWNDPDLYLWIPLYGLAAVSCALAVADRPAHRFNLALIALYGAYAAYLFVIEDGVWSWMIDHQFASLTGSMLASAPWIEHTREFGGLTIMLLVCAINSWSQRKASEASTDIAPEPTASA